LRALSEQNTVFENVAEAMYRYSCDSDVMEQCRKIEDNKKYVAYLNNKAQNLTQENISLKASNADKDNQLADKDNIIADLTARLSYLESQLNKNK
jgi:uncharacterized protein YeeX (DUF496 family)